MQNNSKLVAACHRVNWFSLVAGSVAVASIGAPIGGFTGAVLTHWCAQHPLWDCVGPDNPYLWIFAGVGFVSGGIGAVVGFAFARIFNSRPQTPTELTRS